MVGSAPALLLPVTHRAEDMRNNPDWQLLEENKDEPWQLYSCRPQGQLRLYFALKI